MEDICKHYQVSKGFFKPKIFTIKAVDGVSISVEEGKTLGLVGESGCGKTTLARTILKVTQPTSGRIIFQGKDITHLDKEAVHELHKHIQIVFQNPYSSLDPRMRIKDIVGEPLVVHMKLRGDQLKEKVVELLEMVGLSRDYINRYPHQFSGGQRQRIAIARAIATTPELLVLDEPTSALDVSVQAQILTLLKELQRKFNMTYIFISHNLSVVKYMSEWIATMYKGRIVESAESGVIFKEPLHPYTKALQAAIPLATRGRKVTVAYRPETLSASESSQASGCAYQLRCPYVMDVCKNVEPRLLGAAPGHAVSCHLYTEEGKRQQAPLRS